ncbi:conserved hypothetical protein [Frankia canadensis]|uniref:Uncharacterized protein n=1 Tax=Frankia canadensis TaxID=1836972 RepID=A0A2I2KNP1_9ACTN|nr:hypothetical protein [Frankia canadensis]SNQ47262.1 conserved hypothetical protein [Frankia canadensis]SOU54552.1 conserved hypothetical protein [Frankia canadensis]
MSSRWSARRRARRSHPGVPTLEATRTPSPLVPAAVSCRRPPIRRIEVDGDWRRCGAGEGGCGVLLPLSQLVCPRCGQTNREDLLPLNIRRLLPTHDAYDHAVAVLRGTWAEAAMPTWTGGPETLAITAGASGETEPVGGAPTGLPLAAPSAD